jgi:cysteine synthase B
VIASSLSPAAAGLLELYPKLRQVGNTPLLKIDFLDPPPPAGVEIYAKEETHNPGGSIKDRPVLWMLLEAIAGGELTRDRIILDSSSGNAGIAYAMFGALLGFRVELVVPGNASEERKQRIRAHGAELILTDPLEGYDAAIVEAHRRRQADPERYYMPDQYRNPNNILAHYATTGAEIWEQTEGRITHFVAGVGTGGTITGVGRRLKRERSGIQVVCVNPESFPGIEGLKPLDSPTDLIPENFDATVVDRTVRVTIDQAYAMCHRLARKGVFVGQSSGAFLQAALDLAQQIDRGVIVTVFSDSGDRYFSTPLWRG